MKVRFVICGTNEYTGGYQHYCFNDDVKFNKHGNISVTVKIPQSSGFVSFQRGYARTTTYVFDRLGKCISHPPSKRYTIHMTNAYFADTSGNMLDTSI